MRFLKFLKKKIDFTVDLRWIYGDFTVTLRWLLRWYYGGNYGELERTLKLLEDTQHW